MDIEAIARASGMETDCMNMGAASCVYTDGCQGVSQAQLEAFAALLLGEERERCATAAVDAAAAAVKKYESETGPVRQPYANNRLMHVGWAAADAILRPN
jgi:NifU-like protein involved in Fe-S cluster formation